MPNTNDLNALERAVLNWLARHHDDESLRIQAAAAQFEGREWTGTGFHVHLNVPRDVEPVIGLTWPINGPALESEDIDIAGDTLFWGEDGYLNAIEMYTFGEFFNEEVRAFRIVAFEE